MCFSATASFGTAAVVGAIGAFALVQTRSPSQIPMAAMPLFFAVQQATEGGLWLTLATAPDSVMTAVLTHAFLIFALIFWPVYAPWSAYAIEGDPSRRSAIGWCLGLGVAVALYFVWQLANYPHGAAIVDGHIRYGIGQTPLSVGGFYIVATTLPLLLSSASAVGLLGLIVLTGSVVTYAAYEEAFISVWCFFAAAASIVIAVHFWRAAAVRLPTTG